MMFDQLIPRDLPPTPLFEELEERVNAKLDACKAALRAIASLAPEVDETA